MRRVLLAVLAVAPLATWGQPLLLAGASVGGTWDSNVTRSAQAEGGLFVDASAHIGGGLALADERVLLTGLALYRARLGATIGALSSHAVVASLAGSVAVVDWLRLGASAGGGYTARDDPAQSGERLDVRLFARASPLRWLDLRVGGGWLHRGAADQAFTTQAWEASAGLELRPLQWLELGLGWSWTTGGDVVFVAGTEAAGGAGAGGRWRFASTTGSATTWEPVAVEARTHALGVTAAAQLPHGFGLTVELGWQRSENPLEPWTGWVASLGCSWELP